MTGGDERVPGARGIALSITVLPAPLAICRRSAGAPVPTWTERGTSFLSVSRTPTELSIVADEAAVPPLEAAVRGYRALRVEGPLSLDLVGVIASIAVPLAAAGVPLFPIATHDTDYILVPGPALARAVAALEAAGHRIAPAAGAEA